MPTKFFPPTSPERDTHFLRTFENGRPFPLNKTKYGVAGVSISVDPLPIKFKRWAQLSDEQLQSLMGVLFTFGGFLDEYHHDPNSSAFAGLDLRRLDEPFMPTASAKEKGDIPAKRPLRASEIAEGAWFAVDGPFAGNIYVHFQGISLRVPVQEVGSEPIRFHKSVMYRIFGATEEEVSREELRGAAIIDTDDGSVAGFVQAANKEWIFSPCLDELVDRDWSVV
ncbi:MAG: hypothetical protein Q9218_008178 [Villophora microphyllina]